MIRLYERLKGQTRWYPIGESHARKLVDWTTKPDDTWARLLAGGIVLVAGGQYELARELSGPESDDMRRQIAFKIDIFPGFEVERPMPSLADRPERKQGRLF